jgi:hypothetical protein
MKLSEKLIIGAVAVAGIILLIEKCQPKESPEQVQGLIDKIQEKGKTTCTGKLEGKPVDITFTPNGKGITTEEILGQFTVTTTIQPNPHDPVGFTRDVYVQVKQNTEYTALQGLVNFGDVISLAKPTNGQLEDVTSNFNTMTLGQTVNYMKNYLNNVCALGPN